MKLLHTASSVTSLATHCLLAILLIPSCLTAGGKIKGTVTDKQTGVPIAGATITLEGTRIGVAADANGAFAFVDVPAESYTVAAYAVGYTRMTVSDVRVHQDLSTDLHFALSSEILELGPIEVVAVRPLVNQNSTNALRISTQDDFRHIPVRGIDKLLALVPGVIIEDGNIHIRGGREDEVGYYLDGVSITDPQYGGRGLSLMQEALEEVVVQSGGYEAAYGRANAGIIQHQLRSGSRQFHATLEFGTDNITLRGTDKRYSGEKILGGYLYGFQELMATASGPLFMENLRFFGVGSYRFRLDTSPQSFPGIAVGPITDPVTHDSIDLQYPAGPILKASEKVTSFTGTLSYDIFPLVLRASGAFSSKVGFEGALPSFMLDLDRIPETTTHDGFGSVKGIWFFNSTTYAEASGGLFFWSQKIVDPVLRDDFFAYGDSIANAREGYVWHRTSGDATGRYSLPSPLSIYGQVFFRPGFPISSYVDLERSTLSFNAAFSTVIGQHHTVKIGVDYQRHTLRTYEIWPYGLGDIIEHNAGIPEGDPRKLTLEQIVKGTGVNNYGFDVLGNRIESDDFQGPRHPVFASVFMQDKMEFNDLVVNLGIRYDYIHTHAYALKDPSRPELAFVTSTNEVRPDGLKTTTPFHGFSPRLGLAFPVSLQTVFHAQYGLLVQQSRLRDVNLGLYSFSTMVAQGSSPRPIGFDLRPTRTTQYEIGLAQQIGEAASIDITGYYRDIKDQIVYRLQTTATGSAYPPYPVFENGDFATTKGLEFSFQMRRHKRLQVRASLSLQDAQGSGSFPTSNYSLVASGGSTAEPPRYISPLSYNRAVTANANLDYRFGRDDGGPILADLGTSLLLTFSSGHPYTRPESFGSKRPAEALNTSTTPAVFQVDLRLDKSFRFGESLNVMLYVFVTNLFDRANPLDVFALTGNPDDNGFLQDVSGGLKYAQQYGPKWSEVYRAMAIDYSSRSRYGPPRQIRFGLRLEY